MELSSMVTFVMAVIAAAIIAHAFIKVHKEQQETLGDHLVVTEGLLRYEERLHQYSHTGVPGITELVRDTIGFVMEHKKHFSTREAFDHFNQKCHTRMESYINQMNLRAAA